MMKDDTKYKSVGEYFMILPDHVRTKLNTLRTLIKKTCPEAEEVISYNMPAFRYHGILVYYAATKKHIGFYPANARLIELFKEELKEYETSKGTIRFPYENPLPLKLIRKIVELRMIENREKTKKTLPINLSSI
jgi:uncharacterized protein YdhG (YjbR/CyaY superfamily)